MTAIVSTPAKAQVLTWFSGLAIFFTDSGNSLIIGPLYRSVFDKFRLCREKLAYISRHWDGLQIFRTDGRVEIDSNPPSR